LVAKAINLNLKNKALLYSFISRFEFNFFN